MTKKIKETAKKVTEKVKNSAKKVKLSFNKINRNMDNRIISGVAAGIADNVKIDPTWIRLLFVILALQFFPIFILLYFVAALIMPKTETEVTNTKRLYRIKEHSILGGVTTGLAHYFQIDLVLVRLLFLFSIAFGGIGILMYIILWSITPKSDITALAIV